MSPVALRYVLHNQGTMEFWHLSQPNSTQVGSDPINQMQDGYLDVPSVSCEKITEDYPLMSLKHVICTDLGFHPNLNDKVLF